ncbi:Protein kinase-like domain protein [Cordyceps fumosorosea ARSEF 2679]|uniref:Protein kinase-like domain protein n=1 Tax=Cordyceps fumosorosea (strain ARSEF 2679) TaxID=1081104 RepID=A0A167WKI8_CORFA|nr:Protein kinase-like domain protein [Cordyceps fumosorosea ARSEF 2679]OAA63906.1 Protein kinase-like domain protein [Cordyceps fumosorosea ARSEF 2679]
MNAGQYDRSNIVPAHDNRAEQGKMKLVENVFVDDDWNVTRIIDLEFACAWPVGFWQTSYWLGADFIDEIDYDKLAARHVQFQYANSLGERHVLDQPGATRSSGPHGGLF